MTAYHPTLKQLQYLVALHEHGHFGRAAEACGVTQPTLSSAIKQLEDQLGVQLVFRGSRFQGLTPEGRRVLDRARRIVGDTRALRDEMRALRSGLTGTLRIGVIPTALPMVVDLTTPFTKRHPDVRVTILSRTSAEILTGIERLDLDAGITYLDNEPLGRVTQVPLYPEFYRLVCAPTLPLAQAGRVTWADLAGLPLCLLTGDMQNRRIINLHMAEAGVSVVPMVEASSVIVLISHVLAGGWATVLPLKAADIFLKGGDLVAVLHPERRIYTVSRTAMTEVAIDRGVMRDVYVALGEPVSETAWSVRLHHKPMVNWIWGGCLLMALGGLMAVMDRRYRVRKAASVAPAAPSAGNVGTVRPVMTARSARP